MGRFDANYHLIMYLLKPIEKGLDVKITGGIHSGCLRIQAGTKSDISRWELKGKKIGVPTAIGSPPFLFSQPGPEGGRHGPGQGRRVGAMRPTCWAWRRQRPD